MTSPQSWPWKPSPLWRFWAPLEQVRPSKRRLRAESDQRKVQRRGVAPVSNQWQDTMLEATRLTNEGRLAEATAAIQRALGAISAPVTPEEDTDRTEETIGTTSW